MGSEINTNNIKEQTTEQYMRRALELAYLGKGRVSPNPLVGCVIVKDGVIIGEGWHQKAGEPHAEVNAVNSVQNPEDLKSAKMFVTLEPCAHHGRTPPCSDLIIKMGIPEVYIGCVDPFAQVAGKGIQKLKNAGVNTHVGILEKECLHINRRFFTFHEKKRPYILLKWAESVDGFMDIERPNGETGSHPISHPAASRLTHTWRAEEDAILIGAKTLRTDNPSLTTRKVDGSSPIPIVVTRSGDIDPSSALLQNPKTLVFTKNTSEESDNPNCTEIHFSDWEDLYSKLYERDIQSVLVEGGKEILQNHIDAGMYDEIRIWTSPNLLEKGLPSPTTPPLEYSQSAMGPDILRTHLSNG